MRSAKGGSRFGRLLVIAGWSLAGVVFASAVALAIAVLAFPYPVFELREEGGAVVIVDRNGRELRKVPSRGGRPGREAWVPLGEIRSHAVLALVASEDEGFFDHPGVDPKGIARAAWLNVREGRVGYGGSTITMQLMRMIHSEGQGRTLANKIKEAVLALRLERALGKREILEQYLNRAYYGNGAYGIEAASRTYFDKPAASLSTGEATLLAVIPRSPGLYDPLEHLDRALARRDHVLGLLEERGLMSRQEVEWARAQKVDPSLNRADFIAPHFCDWVLSSLPREVRGAGGVVETTLDYSLQRSLERRVASHVERMRGSGMGQAGVVVIDTRSGEVLAMVGSPGFEEEDGQLNITVRRRHPGSALKPFVYALAMEEGDTPATIANDVHDVPSRYRLKKVTQKEHGPVRYREALAGSYNLAAVHVLEKVGEEKLISTLRRAGVGDVPGDPGDYGLRLALGATKVRLVDLAAGYGFLARGGKVTSPRAVRGATLDGGATWMPERARDRRIFSEEVSWLVMDMLSDPDARRPMFGDELPVDDLPFDIAFKTGTSRGFADTVAVGVTEQYTVAAWAGNFDGKPTWGVIAMDGAAPLVRAGLMLASGGERLTLPARPAGIVERHVCALSGKIATRDCPHRKLERFRAGNVPSETCDWHRLGGDGLEIEYPVELASWADRNRHWGGRGI